MYDLIFDVSSYILQEIKFKYLQMYSFALYKRSFYGKSESKFTAEIKKADT